MIFYFHIPIHALQDSRKNGLFLIDYFTDLWQMRANFIYNDIFFRFIPETELKCRDPGT